MSSLHNRLQKIIFKKDKKVEDDESSPGSQSHEGWTNQLDFTMALIGYAVGLGNIWRFPYICMRNGGGAFLIPYLTFLVLCAFPLFYLECVIGQFSGKSVVSVWQISPLFAGVGWGSLITTLISGTYYSVVLTWAIYFLGVSITSYLPWADCNNSWNTPQCSVRVDSNFTEILFEAGNRSSFNSAANGTETELKFTPKSPSEEFFENNVLELSSGIDDLGGIRWQLLICLFITWLINFLCICKGTKSTGKVVYLTVTLPYVILTILLIRGATLPGAGKGIMYFIKPDFNRLLQMQTWAEAAIQIFCSLGVGWGGIISMARYNKFHNNFVRDAVVVSFVNSFTSLFGGLVAFAVLGYMSHELGLPIDKVVASGPGLAFITYPAALVKIPLSPLWAVLFFVMILTLGLDSLFVISETVISGFLGKYPKLLMNFRMHIAGFTCILGFISGLVYITKGGMYVLQVVDWYLVVFSIMTFGALEFLTISWVYGLNRLFSDIEMMLGFRPSRMWKILWGGVSPAVLCIMLLYNAVMLTTPSYGSYVYPQWALGFGFVIAIVPLLPIPIVATVRIYEASGTLKERLTCLLRSSSSWGPSTGTCEKLQQYGNTGELSDSSPASAVEQKKLTEVAV